MSGHTEWSPKNLSPKTYEYPRIVKVPVSNVGADAANPLLVQLDSTAAEKCIVQIQKSTGTADVYFKYSKSGDYFLISEGAVLTFDGPRHPFWRPFYVYAEGTADDIALVFWLSGTQDGPIQ